MTNRNAAHYLPSSDTTRQSGLFPRVNAESLRHRATRVPSVSDELSGYDICEFWQRVAYWKERFANGDPRRRLLELALLRHDSNLAEAVLRHL